jgi:NAD(P)-dependent dehydrogenase (short-subunit alcohol dehydrogenase family)
MDLELKDKVAMVTGGTQGIGNPVCLLEFLEAMWGSR